MSAKHVPNHGMNLVINYFHLKLGNKMFEQSLERNLPLYRMSQKKVPSFSVIFEMVKNQCWKAVLLHESLSVKE